MNMPRITLRNGVLAGAIGLAILCGCDKKMVVGHYPDFYRPGIHTVVVLPMVNVSLAPEAGQVVTDRLVNALRANGSYDVIGPIELRRRLAAANLTMPEQGDVSVVLPALRSLGGVQAVITGQVSAFSAEAYSQLDYYGQVDVAGAYGWHSHHHPWGVGMGASYPVYEYSWYARSHVAVNVTMMDVASGAVLYSSAGPLTADEESRHNPPPMREEILQQAVDRVVTELLHRIAITPMELKLNPDHDLRLATPGPVFTDKFNPWDDRLLVVLRLPPAAAQNAFRLVVSRKDGPELAGATFTWAPLEQDRTFEFDLAGIVAHAGAGKYTVTFFQGAKAIMRKDFDVKAGPRTAVVSPAASSQQPARATSAPAPAVAPTTVEAAPAQPEPKASPSTKPSPSTNPTTTQPAETISI